MRDIITSPKQIGGGTHFERTHDTRTRQVQREPHSTQTGSPPFGEIIREAAGFAPRFLQVRGDDAGRPGYWPPNSESAVRSRSRYGTPFSIHAGAGAPLRKWSKYCCRRMV